MYEWHVHNVVQEGLERQLNECEINGWQVYQIIVANGDIKIISRKAKV